MATNVDSNYVVRIPRKWWDRFNDESIVEDAHHPGDCDGCGDDELHLIAALIEKRPVRTLVHALFFDVNRDELECLYRQADWYAWFYREVEAEDGEPEFRRFNIASARCSQKFANELQSMYGIGNYIPKEK